jgi:elongation factor G
MADKASSSTGKIARSASAVSGAVMCSRVLGLVREQVFAGMFGAGYAYDAFVVAFRIPNLLRDLFAEGALSAAFVTIFSDYDSNKDRKATWQLASNVLVFIAILLSLITLTGIFFAEPIVNLLAPDFSLIAGKTELTSKLTMIMFPFLIFVALAAVVMGMLNTSGRFFVPAMSSSFFNLGSIIGGVDIVGNRALLFKDDGTVDPADIPADMADEVASMRENLMEYVAETDDDLIEKFLEEGELSDEDLITGLAAGVSQGQIAPVFACAALNNAGSSVILDGICDLLPSPDQRPTVMGTDLGTGDLIERPGTADAPFSAQVFKTMADPFAGRLTIFRVFSGTLKGDNFYNSSKETSERFGQLFLMEGKEQKPVDSVVPGMIVAVAKLKETTTGDTLCVQGDPILYDPLEPMPPVISYAVSATKDEEKLFAALTRLLDEDLTLKLTSEQQTHEVLISGVGQIHLEAIKEKLKRKFGVEMELAIPKIPYRETLKGKVTIQGKHKKQSGGRGQYGDCTVELEPLQQGEHFEFVDKIVGGVIPQQYRPAVEKGILEAMERGVIAGYPFVDLQVTLIDGSYHNVDSSEMAFKIAGSLAFKKGVQEASPILLEPIMEMEIRVDKEHVGDVMGDLNSRRGKVLGMDSADKYEIVNAQVPQAEIQLYAPDLTSMTGGRGGFTVKFSHYEEVPAHIAEKIIADFKAGD